jgi:hypothetical protein
MITLEQKILKFIWNILGILWLPFEVIYIFFSIKDNKFKISNIGIFLSNKLYETNERRNT